MTILPRSDWPASFDTNDIAQAKADIITVNNWMKSQSNITVIDSYALWDNGNGEPLIGYDADGLHCSPIGANAIADGVVNALRPRFGDGASLDLTSNLFTNGNFSGTGASLPSGCSGVLPSPLKAQTIGGTSDNNWRIFSKTAEDHLQIDISVPQGNGTVGVIVRQKIEVGTGYDLLSNLNAACEMEVVSVSGDPKFVGYEIRHEGGPNGNVYFTGMSDDQLNIPAYGPGVCAVPEIDPTDSTILRGRVVIEGDTTNVPLNMTVVLKRMLITQQ